MTFKCLFSSSSRYGTTTWVPALATPRISARYNRTTTMAKPTYGNMSFWEWEILSSMNRRTKLGNQVATQKTSTAKYSSNMSSGGTPPGRSEGYDGFLVRKRNEVMKGALSSIVGISMAKLYSKQGQSIGISLRALHELERGRRNK